MIWRTLRRRFQATSARATRELLPDSARQLGRLLLVHGLLGIIVGVVAALFVELVVIVGQYVLVGTVGIDPLVTAAEAPSLALAWPSSRSWLLLVIPTLGGLAAGWLATRFAPEAMGTGTGAVIDAYHRGNGKIGPNVPWVKSVASALTIGTGGSAGVEGPVGFIAAGIASLLGRVFNMSVAERRVAVMAGFGAGIGAVFHAPMASSIFAAEVLYRDLDLEHEVLVPAIISSTMAYAVFGAIHGWDPVWTLPHVSFEGWERLLPYLVLAVICAVGGALFIKIHDGVEHHIGRNRKLPLWVRPAVGGFGVGLVALFIPQAVGVGYGLGQLAIDGNAGIVVLLVLGLAKMLTSSLTAGSGGSGGLFAPSLTIGALLGGAVALATNEFAPAFAVDPAAFSVVGMAGFFAAVINAPISTVIMVSELAGSYRLLVPTLWVCTIAWFMLRSRSLYSEQVSTRFEAPGHLADMMGAVLRRIRVGDVLQPNRPAPVTVSAEAKLPELLEVFAHSTQAVFPIVSEDGSLLGVVDGRALRRAMGELGINQVVIARDLQAPADTARLDDSLRHVVRRMAMTGYDEVVVVSDDEPPKLLGLLSRREIVSAYHRRMLETTASTTTTSAPIPNPANTTGPYWAVPSLTPLRAAVEHGDVVHDITARTWTEVLEQLVDKAALPETCDRGALRTALVERERLGSTYLGHGIVLPHPQQGDKTFGLDEDLVLIAPLRRAVTWNPTDDGEAPEVHTIVVLLTSNRQAHLALLSSFARVLSNAAVRRLLRQGVAKWRLAQQIESMEPAGPE